MFKTVHFKENDKMYAIILLNIRTEWSKENVGKTQKLNLQICYRHHVKMGNEHGYWF